MGEQEDAVLTQESGACLDPSNLPITRLGSVLAALGEMDFISGVRKIN